MIHCLQVGYFSFRASDANPEKNHVQRMLLQSSTANLKTYHNLKPFFLYLYPRMVLAFQPGDIFLLKHSYILQFVLLPKPEFTACLEYKCK